MHECVPLQRGKLYTKLSKVYQSCKKSDLYMYLQHCHLKMHTNKYMFKKSVDLFSWQVQGTAHGKE